MDISWATALIVWWSVAWRGFIYGLIGGFILGFIGGVVAAMLQDPQNAQLYGMIGGYMGSIPASMLALKQALQKHVEMLVSVATSNVT